MTGFRSRLAWLGLALGSLAVFAGGPVQADCKTFPFSYSQPFVERIVMNPASLLSEFPHGGQGLSTRITIISSSSRAGTTSVINTARLATAHQKRAIAQGLVEAARLCEKNHPVEARAIELAVKKSKDVAFRKEFQNAFESQMEREALARAEQLGNSLRKDAHPGSDSNRQLFDPYRAGTVPIIGGIAPISPIR